MGNFMLFKEVGGLPFLFLFCLPITFLLMAQLVLLFERFWWLFVFLIGNTTPEYMLLSVSSTDNWLVWSWTLNFCSLFIEHHACFLTILFHSWKTQQDQTKWIQPEGLGLVLLDSWRNPTEDSALIAIN